MLKLLFVDDSHLFFDPSRFFHITLNVKST